VPYDRVEREYCLTNILGCPFYWLPTETYVRDTHEERERGGDYLWDAAAGVGSIYNTPVPSAAVSNGCCFSCNLAVDDGQVSRESSLRHTGRGHVCLPLYVDRLWMKASFSSQLIPCHVRLFFCLLGPICDPIKSCHRSNKIFQIGKCNNDLGPKVRCWAWVYVPFSMIQISICVDSGFPSRTRERFLQMRIIQYGM